jgi:hypothetical protein
MGSKQVALQTKQRVPVSPEIVCKLGSNVSAAYYYTQLLYYDRYDHKDAEGWFDKNTREIEDDIGLGRRQQEHSRKILESKGWIETRSIRGGLKPTTMFRVLIRYDSP